MANTKRIERPVQTIKSNIVPLSPTLKAKIGVAFQAVINKIKEKHLS